MKKILFILVLFFICFSSFAVGGNVFHHKKISVIKTQYFDINFDDETLKDAKKIASVADSYYLEIAKKFGTQAYLHFPVTLTREVEALNGFYSPFPYNMIVLYVSEPDSSEMESYSDTLLSVFYHELSHAVTLNIKSPVFRRLSRIFGDFMSPALFSMPYFWIEGAAVFSESNQADDDGGRLKNPYFTALLVQAKINDEAGVEKFPSWRNVLGARDTTPGGSDRYVFGGCFAEYLVETFGMEKYAELWKNAGESTNFAFSAGVFKKTYGKKIDDVWEDFKNSIIIQENVFKSCPEHFGKLQTDKISRRADENFDESAKLVSKKNAFVSTADVFYDEKSKQEKVVFYDSSSRKVYFTKKNLDDEKKKGKSDNGGFDKPKKLFSATEITEVRFSDDGEKIFVKRYVAKKTVRIEKGIFDIKKKKYEVLKDSDDFGKLKKFSCNPVEIEKNGLSWKIIFKQKKYSLEAPEYGKIIFVNPHFLKADEKTAFISFSWAKFGSKNDDFKNLNLPKSGILKINLETDEAAFYLQKNAAFAQKSIHAVNDAALLFSNENETKILAILEDYEQNPLYEISLAPLEDENVWEKLDVRQEPLYDKQQAEENPAADNRHQAVEDDNHWKIAESGDSDFKIEKFSNLPYLFNGTLLPLGIVPLKNDDFETASSSLLGATYITSKPYLDDIIVLSSGINLAHNDAGLLLSYSASDESFDFSSSSSVLFDFDGFRQAAENLSFSRNLWRGLISSFSFGFASDVIYGRTVADEAEILEKKDGFVKMSDGEFWENGFFTKETFFLTFSNVHKVAPKKNQIFGIKFQPFLDFEYKNYKTEFRFDDDDGKIYSCDDKSIEKYLNAGASFVSKIPGIFPLTLTASIFPSSKYFAYGNAQANLLEIEIQKGIPALSIYAARFDLNLSYSGRISYSHGDFWDISKVDEIARDVSKDDYSDRLSLSGLFTLSPNTGYAADSSVQFKIGASVFYRPNPADGQSRAGFGIEGSLGN